MMISDIDVHLPKHPEAFVTWLLLLPNVHRALLDKLPRWPLVDRREKLSMVSDYHLNLLECWFSNGVCQTAWIF